MPRSLQEILDQGDELAARFEAFEPGAENMIDATALREVRGAFRQRVRSEQDLAAAVARARADGHSWASIGAMAGTTGEAARQRYGREPEAAADPKNLAHTGAPGKTAKNKRNVSKVPKSGKANVKSPKSGPGRFVAKSAGTAARQAKATARKR